MPVTAVVVGSGVLGLVIGSFLNVVAWRVPRGESINRPGSHCPVCETPLRPIDNIPVISWVLLRGHCRSCGTAISLRYPLVELSAGTLFALLGLAIGWSWTLLPAFAAAATALVAVFMAGDRIRTSTGRSPDPEGAGRRWSGPRSRG
ncbi:MAG TPA: prepilin peptidase [Acidimicrobiia bacterium]|nr:prepilin peptidase [Acidimicrobiia bacterium]